MYAEAMTGRAADQYISKAGKKSLGMATASVNVARRRDCTCVLVKGTQLPCPFSPPPLQLGLRFVGATVWSIVAPQS